jgi:hypothetical protein
LKTQTRGPPLRISFRVLRVFAGDGLAGASLHSLLLLPLSPKRSMPSPSISEPIFLLHHRCLTASPSGDLSFLFKKGHERPLFLIVFTPPPFLHVISFYLSISSSSPSVPLLLLLIFLAFFHLTEEGRPPKYLQPCSSTSLLFSPDSLPHRPKEVDPAAGAPSSDPD